MVEDAEESERKKVRAIRKRAIREIVGAQQRDYKGSVASCDNNPFRAVAPGGAMECIGYFGAKSAESAAAHGGGGVVAELRSRAERLHHGERGSSPMESTETQG